MMDKYRSYLKEVNPIVLRFNHLWKDRTICTQNGIKYVKPGVQNTRHVRTTK